MEKNLNNAKHLETLQSDYFVRMMLPDAEKKVSSYVIEEKRNLIKLLKSVKKISNFNFVVIGSGTLWYIDLAYESVKKYIAVEPLADIFIAKQVMFVLKQLKSIDVVKKNFGDFSKKILNENNSIFVFHFNILSYINDPFKKINKYLKEGDILYVSSWNITETAINVRKEYFDFLNAETNPSDFKIDPTSTLGLCDLDSFPFCELKFYKSHKRIKGEITDILIVYS